MAETITSESTAVPVTAKKPQDRKPKAAKDGSQTVKVRGVEVTVPRDALDDFELLDDLNALDEGKGQRLPQILRRLIGPEGYASVMDALRDEDSGRVSVEDGALFVHELMAAVSPNS